MAGLSREYRLRYYFRNGSNNNKPLPFRKISTWTPPKANATTEEYLADLPDRLDGVRTVSWKQNLSHREWEALKSLGTNTDLVINKADKGSGVVILDRSEYVAKGESHLTNTDIYKPLTTDPTPQLVKGINQYLDTLKARGLLPHHILDHLKLSEEETRTQRLYFLLKVHKCPVDVRPIVSGCGGPTEKVSQVLDHYLQPLVQQTRSYIRDSKSLVRILETLELPNNVLLCTIDVKQLYLNIPQEEGIQVILQHLKNAEGTDFDPPFTTGVASELMSIVLQQNVFEFNGRMYRQIRGTAMGTKMAPSFAGLVMATLEEDFLASEPTQPLLWRRYIDDIICIWPDGEDTLKEFLNRLNGYHTTLKFTFCCSLSSVCYLDLELYKGNRFEETGILDIRPHYKSTNTYQYLDINSAHPPSVHRGIVKGELVRILRSCSDLETFINHSRKLMEHLKDRGYGNGLLNRAFSEVTFNNRSAYLEDKEEQPRPPPIFKVRYHRNFRGRSIRDALTPPTTVDKPIICYTRSKNIGNYIVRARLKGSATPPPSENIVRISHRPDFRPHSTPCREPLCQCCSFMSRRQLVYGKDGSCHKTPPNTSCSSSSLIYLLECKSCPGIGRYVGQTRRTLRARMGGHRAACQWKRMPVYIHAHKPGHTLTSFRLTILELCRPADLQMRELWWMMALKTIIPEGLNSRYS